MGREDVVKEEMMRVEAERRNKQEAARKEAAAAATRRQATEAALHRHGYIAVLRTPQAEGVAPAIEAYLAGGLRVLEITTTCPNWCGHIQRLRADERLVVGAGTVLSLEHAESALEAGAQFLVSPVLDEEVVKAVVGRYPECVMIPGCATPSELWRAKQLGCDFQKIFPEPFNGVKWVRSVLSTMPSLRLVPTFVNRSNFGAYKEAGVAIIGMGNTTLMPERDVLAGNWDLIEERCSEFLEATLQLETKEPRDSTTLPRHVHQVNSVSRCTRSIT